MFSPIMGREIYTGRNLIQRGIDRIEGWRTAKPLLRPRNFSFPSNRKRDFDPPLETTPPFHSSRARRCLSPLLPRSFATALHYAFPATSKRFNGAALRALTNNTCKVTFLQTCPARTPCPREILIRSAVLREQASEFSPNCDNDSPLQAFSSHIESLT